MKLKNSLLFVALLFVSCYTEDRMTIDQTTPKYDLSDSSDPLQHERYLLYKDFGVVLIDNPDSTDYFYTMGPSTKFTIYPTKLGADDKVKVVKFVRQLLFDAYPKSFITGVTPIKLILASKIFTRQPDNYDPTWPPYEPREEYDHLINKQFYAIFADDIFEKIGDEWEENDLKMTMLQEMMLGYGLESKLGSTWLEDYFADLLLDDVALYGEKYFTGVDIYFGEGDDENYTHSYEEFFEIEDQEDYSYRVLGLPYDIVGFDDNNWGEPFYANIYAEFTDYVPGFIEWSLNTDTQEKERILAEYPKFNQRFTILKTLLKKHINFDL